MNRESSQPTMYLCILFLNETLLLFPKTCSSSNKVSLLQLFLTKHPPGMNQGTIIIPHPPHHISLSSHKCPIQIRHKHRFQSTFTKLANIYYSLWKISNQTARLCKKINFLHHRLSPPNWYFIWPAEKLLSDRGFQSSPLNQPRTESKNYSDLTILNTSRLSVRLHVFISRPFFTPRNYKPP